MALGFMTDPQIRIAIAAKMGFTGCTDANCEHRKCQHLHKNGVSYFPETYSIPRYPDYPNDLNAMHEVSFLLTLKQTVAFVEHLKSILKDSPFITSNLLDIYVVNATAHNRAEAYLRTIGAWPT